MNADRDTLTVFMERWPEIIRKNEARPYFPSYNFFFKKKCHGIDSRAKLERKLWNWYSILTLHGIEVRDRDVLVAGCGSGVECILLALLGARPITALEVVKEFVEGMTGYLADLQMDLGMEPVHHDFHTLPREPRYDLVLTVDAISHMYNYRTFLETGYHLLRRGGRILILDDNNKLNWARRRELREIWQNWESEGRTMEDGRGGQIRFNSYEEDRLALIQEAFPHIEETMARDLAKRTSGMRWGDLHESVVRFLQEGTKPEKFYVKGTMAYDTKLDMPKELPFNPYALAGEMRHIGFRSVRHYPEIIAMTSAIRRLFVRIVRLGKPWMYLFWSKGFSISGKKP